MINKKYLGHNFIRDYASAIERDYKCTICNIKIDYRDVDYGIHNVYLILKYEAIKVGNITITDGELLLTCDEMIIKNIIE